MTSLDNYKSKAPAIIGSSTINHAARVRLGLNCSEYVFLMYLAARQEKGEQADTLTLYIYTGFSPENQQQILKGLMLKGFILFTGDEYEVTRKWFDGFADIEKEFEEFFWKENGKVAWTGTKKKAIEYYIKIRKKYSKEYLLDQRKYYFEYLELEHKRGFDRQRLMAQVFLYPGSERFLEDWKKYCEDIRAKLGLDKPISLTKPITKQEVMEAYAKDTNK
jgi:hypothetical protein